MMIPSLQDEEYESIMSRNERNSAYRYDDHDSKLFLGGVTSQDVYRMDKYVHCTSASSCRDS